MIAHSSGDFNYENIHNHRLHSCYKNYIITAAENLNQFKCLVVTWQRFVSVAAGRYKFVTLSVTSTIIYFSADAEEKSVLFCWRGWKLTFLMLL